MTTDATEPGGILVRHAPRLLVHNGRYSYRDARFIVTGTLDFERLYADPALGWAIVMLELHAESVRDRLLDHVEWASGIAESGEI
jgi:hypothetical protein